MRISQSDLFSKRRSKLPLKEEGSGPSRHWLLCPLTGHPYVAAYIEVFDASTYHGVPYSP